MLCKGTQKYIHRECLNQWRNMNIGNNEKRNSCEICKYKFKFSNQDNTDYSKFEIKYIKSTLFACLMQWFAAIVITWCEFYTDYFLYGQF